MTHRLPFVRYFLLLGLFAISFLVLSWVRNIDSKVSQVQSAKVTIPEKLYNEDLAEYFNYTFLPLTLEDRELTPLLDRHNVTLDESYKPRRKQRVYDKLGPYLDKSGGTGERRFYVARAGEKGWRCFADEFMAKNTLLGVYTGVRTAQSLDSKYEWSYPSRVVNAKNETVYIGLDAMFGGNMLRFINDGNTESLNCRMQRVAWNNRWFTLYLTKRDVYPGDELLISYGSGYWESRDFLQ